MVAGVTNNVPSSEFKIKNSPASQEEKLAGGKQNQEKVTETGDAAIKHGAGQQTNRRDIKDIKLKGGGTDTTKTSAETKAEQVAEKTFNSNKKDNPNLDHKQEEVDASLPTPVTSTASSTTKKSEEEGQITINNNQQDGKADEPPVIEASKSTDEAQQPNINEEQDMTDPVNNNNPNAANATSSSWTPKLEMPSLGNIPEYLTWGKQGELGAEGFNWITSNANKIKDFMTDNVVAEKLGQGYTAAKGCITGAGAAAQNNYLPTAIALGLSFVAIKSGVSGAQDLKDKKTTQGVAKVATAALAMLAAAYSLYTSPMTESVKGYFANNGGANTSGPNGENIPKA